LQLFFYPSTPVVSGSTIETIHIYPTESAASSDFARVVDLELQNGNPMRTPWETPVGYTSPTNADVSTFQCRIPWPGEPVECEFIARYDEFIVIFYARADVISPPGFQEVIGAMDSRINATLAGQPAS
jgi:hypothetical protein